MDLGILGRYRAILQMARKVKKCSQTLVTRHSEMQNHENESFQGICLFLQTKICREFVLSYYEYAINKYMSIFGKLEETVLLIQSK